MSDTENDAVLARIGHLLIAEGRGQLRHVEKIELALWETHQEAMMTESQDAIEMVERLAQRLNVRLFETV